MEWEKCMTPHSTIAFPPLRFDDLLRRVEKAEGFAPQVTALRAGRSGSIDGAWGSSGALAAAALGLRALQTLLRVVPFPRDLDGWADDLGTFTGHRPILFPAWDNAAVEGDVLDEVTGQRLGILKQLEADKPPRF